MRYWILILGVGLLLGLGIAPLPVVQAQECNAPRWTVTFYNTTDFIGSPAALGCTVVVDFDWGLGAPATNINLDNFGVRWTSLQTFPTAGNYQFTVTVEDGARLYINDALLIDSLADVESPQTLSAIYTVTNPGATAFITLEMVNLTGYAQVRLVWALTSGALLPTPTPTPSGPFSSGNNSAPVVSSDSAFGVSNASDAPNATPSGPGGGLPWSVEYYDSPTPGQIPLGAETAAADGINRDYGEEAPLVSLAADAWSARWSRWVDFSEGIYTFSLQTPDSARVSINGVQILAHDEETGDSAPAIIKVQIPNGRHQLIVEHSDADDEASLFLTWDPPLGTSLPLEGCSNGVCDQTGLLFSGTGTSLGVVVRAGPLYFRTAPNRDATTTRTISEGEAYTAIGRSADNVWVQLMVQGEIGWSMSEFLTLEGDINTLSITDGTAPSTAGLGVGPVVQSSGDLGLQGGGVGVISIDPNAVPLPDFVPTLDPQAQAAPTPEAQSAAPLEAGTGVRAKAFGNLRLRVAPNDSAEQIGNIAWGQEVEVIGRSSDGKWLQIIANGQGGWSVAEWYQIIAGDLAAIPVTN
jgi:uncharacterized protein YraI